MQATDTRDADLPLLDLDWLGSSRSRTDFARALERGPVHWCVTGEGEGFWAVLSHAAIVDVCLRPGTFSSAANGVLFWDSPGDRMKGTLALTDPPDHMRLRRFVQPFFTPAGVRRTEDWLRQLCDRLLAEARERGTFDFMTDLAADIPIGAMAQMIGVPQAERARYLRLGNAVLDGMAAGADAFMAAYAEMCAFGRELARLDHSDDSLFAAIRAASEGGDTLDDDEFGGLFNQIASAAVETTRTVMGGIALSIARDRTILPALRADRRLVRTAIEEFLRWNGPVFALRRTVTEDSEIAGTPVKAGQKVMMYYAAANFDPAVFADPFRFDLARNPNPHLTFGVGQHVCLGTVLARTEVRILLEALVAQVEDIELVGEPTRRVSPNDFTFKTLPVRMTFRG